MTGHVAVSLWVEGETLYVWALMVAILGMLMRKQREQLLPGVMLSVAVIATLGVLDRPAVHRSAAGIPVAVLRLPAGDGRWVARRPAGAWQGMEASRQFYYNSWFMWVHPPLLFFSYGAFTVSFVATVQMILRAALGSFETTRTDGRDSATSR